jgi:hypothetical protein
MLFWPDGFSPWSALYLAIHRFHALEESFFFINTGLSPQLHWVWRNSDIMEVKTDKIGDPEIPFCTQVLKCTEWRARLNSSSWNGHFSVSFLKGIGRILIQSACHFMVVKLLYTLTIYSDLFIKRIVPN